MDEIVIYLIIIFFFSSLVRSTFGFGDALIAMPLVAMLAGIKVATPLVALIAIVIAIYILIKEYRDFEIKFYYPLILSSIAGIPIGLIYLKGTNEDIVKLILAIVLISFSIYKLAKPGLIQIKSDKFSFIYGIVAGILGGAYNTNGPPIIIYGTLRGWAPAKFRAILQGIFLPVNVFIVIGHGIGGLWNLQIWEYFGLTLPGVMIAIIIGSKLNKIIPKEKFVGIIYIFLIIIGLVLAVDSILSF